MSYSFVAKASRVSELDQHSREALDDYAATLEGNDYALDQLASDLVGHSIDTAVSFAKSAFGDEAFVSAAYSGHVNTGDGPGSFASVTVTVIAEPTEEPKPTTSGAPLS